MEGQIVQDADRLDALDAIGIVRTIEYGAATGRPFYSPDDATARTGIGHFHDKLFKLRDLMNTGAGRRLAVDRERFMQTFLDQFLLEYVTARSAPLRRRAGVSTGRPLTTASPSRR